jgi:glycosyltransferase involved in cell wall biosynthesis
VLQLTRVLASTGGIETCIRQLSDGLTNRGIDTLVMVPRLDQRPTPAPSSWSVVDASFGDIGGLLQQVNQYDPEVVILHHLADPAVSDGLRALRPTIEVVHGPLCQGGKLFRRGDRLCRHPVDARCLVDWYTGPCGPTPNPLVAIDALRSARAHIAALSRLDRVIVGSSYMRDYLLGEGIKLERISVVDLLEGHAMAVEGRSRLGGQKDSCQLLFVGRIGYNKGLQYLLKALAELDRSFRLEVAGDGWYSPRARELARDLGIDDRTGFLGNVVGADLERAYQRADLVVVPSIWPEPLGLVVGEARRYGVPVVVSDAGGLPEWADDDAGVVVAPRADASGLASVIRRVREQPTTAAPPSQRSSESLLDLIVNTVYEAR